MLWLIRHTTVISLLLAGGLAGVLFSLKYEVQALEAELQDLNRSIAADRDAIHVLRAEWSHLNDPTRLKSLAERHLDLVPVQASQFGSVATLPMRPVEGSDAAQKPAEPGRGVLPARGGAR